MPGLAQTRKGIVIDVAATQTRVVPPADSWNPDQYDKFQAERRAPFFDLLSMIDPRPAMRMVDLGCGTGELTAILHRTLEASETLGIDRSPAMLEKSAALAAPNLRFASHDIATFTASQPLDLVFSNAALHWLPDHPDLFRRLASLLGSNGQLAVQMPANHDQPTHSVARDVAGSEPFHSALDGYVLPTHVLPPERYAALLAELGFARQRVELRVYVHQLDSTAGIVEWVKGAALTAYRDRLDEATFERFVAEYRRRLIAELGDHSPYVLTFNRILLWAGRAA